MARGTLLSELRTMLKAEIADSNSGNANRDAELNALLANKQKLLASQNDWPFLQRKWDLSCSAGDRYVVLPTQTGANDVAVLTCDISFERPVCVKTKYNDQWYDVEYGIDEEAEYNAYDSDDDERTSPILRWRMADNANEENKIEIWPVPNEAQTIRFIGQRSLKPLTDDAHSADLDDMLLVLTVAAEYWARVKNGGAMAQVKAAQARERFMILRAMQPRQERKLVMGSSQLEEVETINLVRIGGVA